MWRCFQLWNARRAWRPCLVSPGGRGLVTADASRKASLVPFQVSSQRVTSSVPHRLSFLFSCFNTWRVRGDQGALVGWTGSTARRPWGLGWWPVWRRCPSWGWVGAWLLSLVVRVLVCHGRRGYGAWLHGVIGLLWFRGLLVGLWAWGRGCQ